MEKSKDLAILVYSCWKNRDMWEIFMTLVQKYWADCNYKIVLLTDNLKDKSAASVFDDVVIKDGTWYEMIMAGIEKANTEFIMMFMDDYLVADYVKNEDIEKYILAARKYHAANIRFMESPTIIPEIYEKDEKFNYYKPGTAYSISTQIGIWNVEFLKKNISKDWSAWDFERKGSIDIIDYEHPMLAAREYVFPYEEGVRRGKWMDNGVRVCKRNNIQIDFSKRKQMSNFELAWIYFKGGILSVNPTLVVKIQNTIAHLRRK